MGHHYTKENTYNNVMFYAEVIRMNLLLATAANPVIEQEVAKWLRGGGRKKRDDMKRAEMVRDSDDMRQAEMVRDSDDTKLDGDCL